MGTTIRVSEQTRDRFARLADETGRPMTQLLDEAADALERRVFFEQFSLRYKSCVPIPRHGVRPRLQSVIVIVAVWDLLDSPPAAAVNASSYFPGFRLVRVTASSFAP